MVFIAIGRPIMENWSVMAINMIVDLKNIRPITIRQLGYINYMVVWISLCLKGVIVMAVSGMTK